MILLLKQSFFLVFCIHQALAADPRLDAGNQSKHVFKRDEYIACTGEVPVDTPTLSKACSNLFAPDAESKEEWLITHEGPLWTRSQGTCSAIVLFKSPMRLRVQLEGMTLRQIQNDIIAIARQCTGQKKLAGEREVNREVLGSTLAYHLWVTGSPNRPDYHFEELIPYPDQAQVKAPPPIRISSPPVSQSQSSAPGSPPRPPGSPSGPPGSPSGPPGSPPGPPGSPPGPPGSPSGPPGSPPGPPGSPSGPPGSPPGPPGSPPGHPDSPPGYPDSPSGPPGFPRLRPDSPQPQPNSLQPQPGSPRLRPDSPQPQPNSLQPQPGSPRLRPDSPQPQPNSLQPPPGSPRLRPDDPPLPPGHPFQPGSPQPQLGSPRPQPGSSQPQRPPGTMFHPLQAPVQQPPFPYYRSSPRPPPIPEQGDIETGSPQSPNGHPLSSSHSDPGLPTDDTPTLSQMRANRGIRHAASAADLRAVESYHDLQRIVIEQVGNVGAQIGELMTRVAPAPTETPNRHISWEGDENVMECVKRLWIAYVTHGRACDECVRDNPGCFGALTCLGLLGLTAGVGGFIHSWIPSHH